MSDRSNVLLIMCDQLRHDALGYSGCSFARTPNLDRLARQGAVFTHCVSNAPLCTPARIGLATGMMPHRLGALTNHAYLRFSTPTYYQRLRDCGYYVGCVGKLDFAKPDLDCGVGGNLPRTYAWGFTHPVECMGRMDILERERVVGSFAPADPYTAWLDRRGLLETFRKDLVDCKGEGWLEKQLHDSYLPTEAWEDMFIANRAAQWIEETSAAVPWHLFVSFVGPHDPLNAPTEFAEWFRDVEVGEPIPGPGDDKPGRIRSKAARYDPAPQTPRRSRRQYAACVAAIDAGVERIIDVLKRRGMLDNTTILFTADHGEMLYDHGLVGKSVPYEAAVRVPLFICGPGIERATISNTLVELIDVGETVCDIARVPNDGNIDALSFLPTATGRQRSHRRDAVSALDSWSALRTHRYKYVENVNDIAELYDLSEDPLEQHNMASERPDIVRELHLRLRDRMMAGGCRR